MTVIGVVQARLGSARLRRKVLLPLGGQPMVAAVAERLRLARSLDAVVAAIPFAEEDLEAACAAAKLPTVHGSERDLIDRYLRVFDAFPSADAICRITADEALIDPAVVDLVVMSWRQAGGDYCSNVHPRRSWPEGLDCEVIARPALRDLDRLTRGGGAPGFDAREEFTRLFWDLAAHGLFTIHGIEREPDGLAGLHWSVDTLDDYWGAQAVYEHLPPGFRWEDVLRAFGSVDLARMAPGEKS